MDTLVLVSRSSWDEAPRTRHQIAECLAPHYRIVYVALPGGWVRHGRTRSAHRRLREDFFIVTLDNLALPPERVLAASPWLRRRLRRAWAAQVERAAARLATGRVALVNFTHDHPELMRSPAFDAALYVCHDDWVGLARPGLKPEAARLEERTAGDAGLCLALSDPLKERLERFNPRTRLLLAAHSFGDQRARWRAPAPPYVLGFVGYINARLETAWLVELLRDPAWEVRLVGKVEPSFAGADALARTGRCRFLGEVRGGELFRVMSEAHVLSFPYAVRPETVAITAPNKLFAYLATGRPVVSSALPRLYPLPRHFLATASGAAEFADRVKAAVAGDSEERFRERVGFAAAHTWESRAGELRREIDGLLGREAR